jgi:hypothetical protein
MPIMPDTLHEMQGAKTDMPANEGLASAARQQIAQEHTVLLSGGSTGRKDD